jgi:hypothetical protein
MVIRFPSLGLGFSLLKLPICHNKSLRFRFSMEPRLKVGCEAFDRLNIGIPLSILFIHLTFYGRP